MLVPQLGSEFLPELNEGSIWVNFTLPPGIAPGEVNRTLHRVREELCPFRKSAGWFLKRDVRTMAPIRSRSTWWKSWSI